MESVFLNLKGGTMEPNKKAWQSKTILMAAIVGLAAILKSLELLPVSIDTWVSSHQDIILMGLSAVGIGLRLITKGKIELI